MSEPTDSLPPGITLDWSRRCAVCYRRPTVFGHQDGQVIYAGHLCGICLWGSRLHYDPADWDNHSEEHP